MVESDFAGGCIVDGLRHLGERSEDFWGLGPDGDFVDGVAIDDGGLLEAVDDSERCGAFDAGDVAAAVAEAWRVALACRSYGVAAGVDGDLLTFIEHVQFEQSVELFGFGLVGGLVGEADVGEQAFVVVDEVGVNGAGKVFGRGRGL